MSLNAEFFADFTNYLLGERF